MDNQTNYSQEHFWTLLCKKLSKEANEDELSELESLLLKNHDLQLQAEMITMMWVQQGLKRDTTEADAAYMRHLLNYREEFFPDRGDGDLDETHNDDPREKSLVPIPFFRKSWFIGALSITCIATICWFAFRPVKAAEDKSAESAISSITTKNGNRSKITLPDGTQVWLNAGSKLDYNNVRFNKSLREVYLVGEAYFDVVKNPQKPFLVHTDNFQIKVLGTAFDVKAYPGDKESETSLIRGSVEITVPGREEKFVLHPNEKLVLSNKKSGFETEEEINKKVELKDPETIFSLRKVDYLPDDNIITETSWVENKLVFRSEKFFDIAKKLERWFGVTIQFSDKRLEEIVLTGTFENETVDEAMEYLRMAESFNYIIEGKKITIKP